MDKKLPCDNFEFASDENLNVLSDAFSNFGKSLESLNKNFDDYYRKFMLIIELNLYWEYIKYKIKVVNSHFYNRKYYRGKCLKALNKYRTFKKNIN